MKDVVAAIRDAKDEPSTEKLEVMWRRVFRLPAWYFLQASAEGPATPLVGRLNDGDWVLGFKHFRAINEFGRDAGMLSEGGEIPMLALPPSDAIDHLREVAEHVAGIQFNIGGELAFRAPVAALLQFAEQFGVAP